MMAVARARQRSGPFIDVTPPFEDGVVPIGSRVAVAGRTRSFVSLNGEGDSLLYL